jgi:hypothetical protein
VDQLEEAPVDAGLIAPEIDISAQLRGIAGLPRGRGGETEETTERARVAHGSDIVAHPLDDESRQVGEPSRSGPAASSTAIGGPPRRTGSTSSARDAAVTRRSWPVSSDNS